MAEALALWWCLRWILTANQDGQFLIETDIEVALKCIQGMIRMAEIENIILDCIDILSTLSNCTVAFIKRTMNGAAISLVGVAKQFDGLILTHGWDMSLNL